MSHRPAIAQPASRPSRASLVAAAAAGAGVLVAVAGARHARGRPLALDVQLRAATRGPRLAAFAQARRTGRSRTRSRAVGDAFGHMTDQWPTTLAGVAAAAAVARRHGLAAALPALVAVPLTNATHGVVKYSLRERRPLLAWLTGKRTPAFPSGHAARGAALAAVLAHLAARERVAPAGAVLAAGVAVAIAGGANRAWMERHWVSDLVGGWALGAAAGAGCALWYDAVRARAR